MKTVTLLRLAAFFSLLPSTLRANDSIQDYWFNGAEISRYDLTQSRYGNEHPGHAEFIFVTEPFLTKEQVKHEFGQGVSTDVLKLNALRTFNTGIYSYRTMTSTFKPIDIKQFPHSLKTTTSIQDWCGQAYQQINRDAVSWSVELRSYFQEQGDKNFKLEDAWLEEDLWLLTRLAPEKLPTGNIEIIPGAVYTRFAHLPIKPYSATGLLKAQKDTFKYILTYSDIDRILSLQFDKQFPHTIRAWSESNATGTTKAVLKEQIKNSYYWSQNKPSDRVKRKQLGLSPVAD